MITLSKNKRYLEKNGKFFPYLADTAWTLLQKLDREEIVYYLDIRKAQGFNALQISAISELDGLRMPNREGQLPFENGDVYDPNPKYFGLLRFLLTECRKRDMVLTLLPSWGDKFNKKWGVGPEIFTPSNALFYGEYLSGLVEKNEDVIFMLGGDRPIENDNHKKIIDSMAAGLRKGEKAYHLVTYHPCGEATSLDFLKNCDYLDFHSIQSGHSFGGFSSEKMIKSVLEQEDKPCLDAESFYEDFPIDFNLDFNYRFDPHDIRKRIYGNMLAGSLGTVYGHQSVWCFKEAADAEYPYNWKNALFRPMANEIKNINIFLDSVDITDMRPYKECYNTEAIADEKRIVVLFTDKKTAYLRLGNKKTVSAMWFDIVKGKFIDTKIITHNGNAIIPPFDNEALLVIDCKDDNLCR